MPPQGEGGPSSSGVFQRTQWNCSAPSFRPQIFDADFITEYFDQSSPSDDFSNTRDIVTPLTEEEDMMFQRLLVTERRFHEFSCFYETEEICTEMGGIHFHRSLLGGYTHHHAVDFIAKSRVWMKRDPPTENLPIASVKDKVIYQFTQVKGSHALYRVYLEKEGKYILLACHMNVHGFHRGDLRFIEVNNRTKTDGSKFSCIGHLYPGDYIAVTELARTDEMPDEMGDVMAETVNQETPCVWMARNIAVMERRGFKNIPFTFIQNETAVSIAFLKSLSVKLTPGFDFRESEGRMFLGKGFDPTLIKSEFAGSLSTHSYRSLLIKTAKLTRYPDARPIITNFILSQLHTSQFNIGVDAYKLPNMTNPEDVVELCVLMGQSAAHVILSDGFDSRGFPMGDPSKEGNIVRFTIPNTESQRTDITWRAHTRIVIGSSRRVDASATIESVIFGNDVLRISARLSQHDENFEFSDPIHVVHQKMNAGKRVLKKGFFKELPLESNGRKIIETLYGGASLDHPLRSNVRTFMSISNDGYFFCNACQNEYITRLLDEKSPLTLANAPFGCGKSMTIAVAALYSLQRNNEMGINARELLVTQSNYASVNLVEIISRLTITRSRCIRFVNECNWNELSESCKTPLDSPHVMQKFFFFCVMEEMYWNDDDELFQMILYLLDRGAIKLNQLGPRAHHVFHERRGGREKYTHFNYATLLFKVYNPEIVISTFDTLPTILPLLGNVSTVQFDEASQVPESTLISVLSWVPRACFGLVGDIRQLPPFCTDALNGKLKEYGVGSTMERSVNGRLFPQAHLKYVYRCHPVTTSLLGSLFYQNQLISAVKAEQRDLFMRYRSDIWLNPAFPIMIINNNSQASRMGTSLGNQEELQIVQSLICSMLSMHNGCAMRPIDIGVISFYKAQESLLTERLRGTGIKCGTVDSFQGAEKEVMIVCCTSEYITNFTGSPNRINVAMSRAKQATIIIANANGLGGHHLWRQIDRAVRSNNCYRDMFPMRS